MIKVASSQSPATNIREEKALFAGFGGQGIMLLGRIVAEAAVLENRNVTYIRSYGGEIRGGTAHCLVKVSEEDIASPVFEKITVAIIMNQPSLDKFRNRLIKKGVFIVNKSLITKGYKLKDKKLHYYPLNKMANSLDNLRVANIIALGILLRKHPLVRKSSATEVIKSYFSNKVDILKLNLRALELGWNTH